MTEAEQELARRLEGIDLYEDRLTYAQAAVFVEVPEPTIRQWKSRHHLDPAGKDPDGRLLFRPIDVLRAEAKTRWHARRRFPQGG